MCLVICSRESETKIEEAASAATYGGAIKRLRLDDPYGGRGEIERLVAAARGHFVGADEVILNVTGGTTLMGLATEALAAEARRLAGFVRRFGLIDRGPPKERDENPYRAEEPFWLDGTEAEGAAGD